jgi:FSR family fosmidomycin resistance protein-like MFS transporter
MSEKFQKNKIIAISSGHFFHDVYSAFLAPMLPLLIQKFGISLSLAGLLDIIRKLPTLLNPIVGIIADKTCVKYFVILTPGITAISMSLLGLAPSYGILFILLFVMGISSTLFHVPAPVMIKNFSGNKVGTGMSYFMFGGELARTIGPLLITAGISIWGLEGSYRIMPLGIIASIILFFQLKDIKPIPHHNVNVKKKKAWDTLKDLMPFFIAIGGFTFFQAGMKTALTLYLPTYLTGKGDSLWMASISLSILQLAGAAGTFGAGFLSDKITHKNTLLITAILSPVIMWVFILTGEGMIPVLIVLGLLLFASGPILLAIVQETNTSRPAFVNSIYMTINFGVSSIMVLFIGVLGDLVGLDITFKVCATIALFSIPFIFLISKTSGKNTIEN